MLKYRIPQIVTLTPDLPPNQCSTFSKNKMKTIKKAPKYIVLGAF